MFSTTQRTINPATNTSQSPQSYRLATFEARLLVSDNSIDMHSYGDRPTAQSTGHGISELYPDTQTQVADTANDARISAFNVEDDDLDDDNYNPEGGEIEWNELRADAGSEEDELDYGLSRYRKPKKAKKAKRPKPPKRIVRSVVRIQDESLEWYDKKASTWRKSNVCATQQFGSDKR